MGQFSMEISLSAGSPSRWQSTNTLRDFQKTNGWRQQERLTTPQLPLSSPNTPRLEYKTGEPPDGTRANHRSRCEAYSSRRDGVGSKADRVPAKIDAAPEVEIGGNDISATREETPGQLFGVYVIASIILAMLLLLIRKRKQGCTVVAGGRTRRI